MLISETIQSSLRIPACTRGSKAPPGELIDIGLLNMIITRHELFRALCARLWNREREDYLNHHARRDHLAHACGDAGRLHRRCPRLLLCSADLCSGFDVDAAANNRAAPFRLRHSWNVEDDRIHLSPCKARSSTSRQMSLKRMHSLMNELIINFPGYSV